MYKKLVILFLAVAISSCVNDELCVGTGTNEIKVSFFQYGTGSDTPTSVTFDSIAVSGFPENYPYFRDSTASTIGLTVDPDTTWTQFVMITTVTEDSLRYDTLEVDYSIIPSLISLECGPELLFSELDTLYSTFDSLVIELPIFDLEVETNLKIYY